MTRVTKIDGSPGAGKTYTLRQKLSDEKRGGLGSRSFWWLNFTNSGREDVEPEIKDVYPNEKDMDERAKTMHGLALSLVLRDGLLDTNGADKIIMQGAHYGDEWNPYADFCERNGLSYDPDAADPRKLLAGEKETENTGNQFFAINDFLRQTCKPPEKWTDAPQDTRIPGENVKKLLRAWRDYKRHVADGQLVEHGDYVKMALDHDLVPDVDVLLIDEFQDFAPLEYALYKNWRDSGRLDRMYIAGDPNQSIYSFRGGTPHYFRNTEVDDVIDLKDSRRCPSRIADVGSAVLDAHDDTDARGFSGMESGGNVRTRSFRGKSELAKAVVRAADSYDSDPSVLLLTRTNYQLRQLENDLRDVGVPFEVLGSRGGFWQGKLRQILAFLNNLKSGGEAFAWSNVRKVLGALPDGKAVRSEMPRAVSGVVDRDGIAPLLERYGSALAIVRALDVRPWIGDVLENAVNAPAAMKATEVQVGTIHTAKGLEAPSVFLFADTSENTVTRYWRDDDHAAEEHRTYYVGATRASEELTLVSGYFDGPTAPPLKGVVA